MPFIDNIFQPTHLLVVLVVALLVLGPKRLPDVARAIGRGMHDFKRAVDDVKPSREDLLGPAESDLPAAAPADRRA